MALCGGSAFAVSGRPDLVETAVAVSRQGATVAVTDVTRNRGAATAARSTTAYYLAGVRLGARPVEPLRPGAASRGSVRLAVPKSIAPGPHRLLACADDSRRIAETNERNNCRAATQPVEVVDRTPPVFAGLESAVTCIPGPAGGPTRTSSYRLTWPAAHDDVTPAAGLVYDIYQANVPGGEDFSTPTYTADAGSTSYLTPALPDDRAYYFVVRARDRRGNRDTNTVERRGTNLCL